MNEAAPMNWCGAFCKIYYYVEEQAIEEGVYHAKMCFKNKILCMHILIYTLINFGRKHKGLVTEAAFQEVN